MSGWRAVAGSISRRLWVIAPPLVVGDRYVCDLGGAGERLVDLELIRVEDWIEAFADGVLDHGVTARFRGPRGESVEVPRENVLWHGEDHALIMAAAVALDVPLVPTRRRPVPRWRVGAARVDLAGMVELGRILKDGGER